MKAFISVDMEGMPYIASLEHLDVRRKLFNEARKIMTIIVKSACEHLHNHGFDEVVVADSHGHMVNIEFEELPEYVEIINGFPRALSMITGGKECDVALMLGYHAKSGTMYSIFDHTYSGSIVDYVKLNGIEVSEFLLNAYALGYYGVPVILVAGESKLIDEVKEYTPWVETVVFKTSFSGSSAKSPSIKRVINELKNKIESAVKKYREGRVKPLEMKGDVELTIRFKSSVYADVAEFMPMVKRVDGRTIIYKTSNIIEAYKVLELLVLASFGARLSVLD